MNITLTIPDDQADGVVSVLCAAAGQSTVSADNAAAAIVQWVQTTFVNVMSAGSPGVQPPDITATTS